jgi:hypothetical protein
MPKKEIEESEEYEEEEEEEVLVPPIKGKTQTFQYFDLSKNARDLLCNSMVMYGETGDGKSYITNNILYQLSPYVNIVFVFSPTARVDKSFPMAEYTSPSFVYETLDMQKIKAIMEFGRDRAAMLREIEDVNMLKETVKDFILPFYASVDERRLFDKAKAAYSRICKLTKRFNYDKATKMERDQFNRELVRYYRVILFECKNYLYRKKIKVPAKYKKLALPVLFHDIKPYNVVVTNDFGETLGSLKKDDAAIASELVMKERHYNITTIHLVQNVNQIKKPDRAQIKINIFLSPTTINSYISTLNIKGTAKKKLEEASEYILSADRNKAVRKYPVVIYFKLEEKIMFTYADAHLDVEQIGNVKLYKALERFAMNHNENNPLADIFH